MTGSYICPRHGYAHLSCNARCAKVRAQLKRLENDYRQYWSDRRRGVKPLPAYLYRMLYGGRA